MISYKKSFSLTIRKAFINLNLNADFNGPYIFGELKYTWLVASQIQQIVSLPI